MKSLFAFNICSNNVNINTLRSSFNLHINYKPITYRYIAQNGFDDFDKGTRFVLLSLPSFAMPDLLTSTFLGIMNLNHHHWPVYTNGEYTQENDLVDINLIP